MIELAGLITALISNYDEIAALVRRISRGTRVDSAEGLLWRFSGEEAEADTGATLRLAERMERAAGLSRP